MTWIKKYWDDTDGFLEHDKKQYAIPVRRFLEGIGQAEGDWPHQRTWFYHLSEKNWITFDDLYELMIIFKQQYPNINWDYYFNSALKVNPKKPF